MELFEVNPFVRFAQRRQHIPKYNNFVMTYDYRLFYAYSGTIEIVFEKNSVFLYENQFVSLTKYTYNELLNKGIEKDKVKYIHDQEGIHHESFWNKYFNAAVNFWFVKNK